MSIEWNEISEKSFGGTELMGRRLERSIPKDLLKKFQIILSRVRDVDPERVRILWCHDLPNDPESKHLENEGWKKFHKIVFVSHWQREAYVRRFEIPYSRTCVIHNAIEPITDIPSKTIGKDDTIRFIYSTTPHRGLEILVPVFERLAENYNVHLDVYSSFGIYGWAKRDEPYKPIFEKIENHPNMKYHGYQPNEVVREALTKSHIFAYCSIWPETSCLALMEAMSAKCICIHSDYAALPETAANWTTMYEYHEDPSAHASRFYSTLKQVIEGVREHSESVDTRLLGQKSYCDLYYNWEIRKEKWMSLLDSLKDSPLEIERQEGPFFSYSVP